MGRWSSPRSLRTGAQITATRAASPLRHFGLHAVEPLAHERTHQRRLLLQQEVSGAVEDGSAGARKGASVVASGSYDSAWREPTRMRTSALVPVDDVARVR